MSLTATIGTMETEAFQDLERSAKELLGCLGELEAVADGIGDPLWDAFADLTRSVNQMAWARTLDKSRAIRPKENTHERADNHDGQGTGAGKAQSLPHRAP